MNYQAIMDETSYNGMIKIMEQCRSYLEEIDTSMLFAKKVLGESEESSENREAWQNELQYLLEFRELVEKRNKAWFGVYRSTINSKFGQGTTDDASMQIAPRERDISNEFDRSSVCTSQDSLEPLNITDLPETCLLELFSHWITLPELSRFDVALCNHTIRSTYDRVLCNKKAAFDGSTIDCSSECVEWLLQKNMSVKSLTFSPKHLSLRTSVNMLDKTFSRQLSQLHLSRRSSSSSEWLVSLLQICGATLKDISVVCAEDLKTMIEHAPTYCPNLQSFTHKSSASKDLKSVAFKNFFTKCKNLRTLRLNVRLLRIKEFITEGLLRELTELSILCTDCDNRFQFQCFKELPRLRVLHLSCDNMKEDAVKIIADKCPLLKSLSCTVFDVISDRNNLLRIAAERFQELEVLTYIYSHPKHCHPLPSFASTSQWIVQPRMKKLTTYTEKTDFMSIAEKFPNLVYLKVSDADINCYSSAKPLMQCLKYLESLNTVDYSGILSSPVAQEITGGATAEEYKSSTVKTVALGPSTIKKVNERFERYLIDTMLELCPNVENLELRGRFADKYSIQQLGKRSTKITTLGLSNTKCFHDFEDMAALSASCSQLHTLYLPDLANEQSVQDIVMLSKLCLQLSTVVIHHNSVLPNDIINQLRTLLPKLYVHFAPALSAVSQH